MPSEKDLINQLQVGNTRALSSLYDKYSGALYGVIVRMCKDDAQAQDILQETFVKIWQKCSSYDSEKGNFYTWAYRIARNTTLNSLRSKNNLIQNDDLSVYTNKAEEETSNIDLPALSGSLKKLDSHHQRALELVYFEGLTHKEAHIEMDVPLGTFKSYIRQAIKQLREHYPMQSLIIILLTEWMT